MRSNALSAPPRPTTDTIRRYVGALPATGETPLLDERAAQAARSVLERSDPVWEHRLQMQIETITKELSAHLDYDSMSGRYAITGAELRGIVARAISRTTAQFAMDVGRVLAADTSMSAQFTSSAQADDTQTGDYEQPDALPEI